MDPVQIRSILLTFLAADSIPWANSKVVLNDNSLSESKRCWIIKYVINPTDDIVSEHHFKCIAKIAKFSNGATFRDEHCD